MSRLSASAGPGAAVSGVTVLGVPPDAIRSMPLWRDEWGSTRGGLADAIASDGPAGLRGVPLRASELVLEVDRGLLSFHGIVEQPDGSFRTLDLGSADPARARVLRARLPESARGGRLVAIELVAPRLVDRGADAGIALRGTTRLRIPGASLAGWIGEGGVTVSGRSSAAEVRVAYAVTAQRHARVRPRQPSDANPPAAAVTTALGDLAGGVGGTLPLRIGGETVDVRVAAVVERMPGTTGEAVVADRAALETAVDTRAPGAAPIGELWLDVADGARARVESALSRRPFAVLEKRSREQLEDDARQDPLGHGTLLALGAAALAALGLAVWGLVLAIRADLRDDRGELADLEAQGATPALLRRVVTARAALVAAIGVLGGVVGGALLALLVTRVVSVTARATAPEPPLVTTVDPLVLAAAAVAFAASAAALVLLTTRRAFSEPRGPGRIGGSG